MNTIKIMRTLAGKSQEKLAEEMGTYQVRIHRIETGKTKPKPEEQRRIFEILGMGERDEQSA